MTQFEIITRGSAYSADLIDVNSNCITTGNSIDVPDHFLAAPSLCLKHFGSAASIEMFSRLSSYTVGLVKASLTCPLVTSNAYIYPKR